MRQSRGDKQRMNAARRLLIAAAALVPVAFPVGARETSAAPILLFNGTGTSPNDVAAVERILRRNHFEYATADSRRMNAISEAGLRRYRLLIVPGGDFEKIGKGLTAEASANIRSAVRGGLNYLGICAGAFFAGDSPYNGLNITGVRFAFYALEREGVRKAAVPIAVAGSPTVDQYWEDGPQLAGWGEVVARYPDGTPAVVQGAAGDGWVILAGIHAEAPESWRRGLRFTTPASVSNAYAATLIGAALSRTRLAHD
jgi:Biotin-protein ligase, N terminal